MKTLQNNFTTPEQSKRLLELGVPADSADCYYTNSIPYSKREDYSTLYILPFGSDSTISSLKELAEEDGGFVIPCWSVGRLIEIYTIASDADFIEFDVYANSPCVLRELLERFENNIDKLDFSKLED